MKSFVITCRNVSFSGLKAGQEESAKVEWKSITKDKVLALSQLFCQVGATAGRTAGLSVGKHAIAKIQVFTRNKLTVFKLVSVLRQCICNCLSVKEYEQLPKELDRCFKETAIFKSSVSTYPLFLQNLDSKIPSCFQNDFRLNPSWQLPNKPQLPEPRSTPSTPGSLSRCPPRWEKRPEKEQVITQGRDTY